MDVFLIGKNITVLNSQRCPTDIGVCKLSNKMQESFNGKKKKKVVGGDDFPGVEVKWSF